MLHTLAAEARHEEDIRKSRFLAIAGPVQSAEEALQFIAAHSVPDATHNCWAYRVGQQYRFNDDGEPGGTAGRPILQAIEGQQCDGVAVLVVRWFGGIKLGAGGLVRAYGGTAAECLRRAPKVEIRDEVEVLCRCAFADMALVRARLAEQGASIVDEQFEDSGVCWRLKVAREDEPALAERFINLTRGQGGWNKEDEG